MSTLKYDPSNPDAHCCGYLKCRGGQIAPDGSHYDCPGPPGFRTMPEAPIAWPTAPAARTWSEAITDWQLATFGPVTPARAWARFDEEFNELVDADCEPTEPPEKIAEEAADVVITFAAWVLARTGLDLAAAIERKMQVNLKREWNVDGEGGGYHVKPTGGAE